MSEFKVGQRVRVPAFEGTYSHGSSLLSFVSFVDIDGIRVAVEASLLEPIAAPVKVGDVITSVDQLAALPVRTVLHIGGDDEPLTGEVWANGILTAGESDPREANRLHLPAAVLYLPESA